MGGWEPGSGKLDLGVDLESNVLREVFEEYGCKGKIQEQLPAHDMFRKAQGFKTHWLAIPFFILVNPLEVKNNEPHKIDEIGWFRLDNLPEPLTTGFSFTLNKFPEYFAKYG